jgi:hypothetical protein
MKYYHKIYYTLCESRKKAKKDYKPFSGLHKHHILPKHSGGNDGDENLTFLTIREHIIAHFLLWKMYKNPNDLRAMCMLGSDISPQQRKVIGEWCRDKKIGFHSNSFDKEMKKSWRLKGLLSQKNSGIENTFYYWSTEDGRKKRSSLGGKKSITSPNNPWSFWASPAGRKKRSSLGGKSHLDKKVMHKPGDTTFKRILPQDVQTHLENGYIFGSPIPNKNKNLKTGKPSARRRKVTDGLIIYNSIEEAAEKNNLTPGTIIYRCKSEKSIWCYVSET